MRAALMLPASQESDERAAEPRYISLLLHWQVDSLHRRRCRVIDSLHWHCKCECHCMSSLNRFNEVTKFYYSGLKYKLQLQVELEVPVVLN